MFRPFEFEIRHFALDNARVSAWTACWQGLTDNVRQEALPEALMVGRIHQLKFRDGRANEVQRLDKTEAVGIKVISQSSLMHDKADNKMGQAQGIQLLDDADGLERTQGTRQEALVDFDFIQGDFDFPTFMIQHNQLQGRITGRVKQGGD